MLWEKSCPDDSDFVKLADNEDRINISVKIDFDPFSTIGVRVTRLEGLKDLGKNVVWTIER